MKTVKNLILALFILGIFIPYNKSTNEWENIRCKTKKLIIPQPRIKTSDTLKVLYEVMEVIKKYETWHKPKNFPYVGYGHKLLKGEKYDYHILTKKQGNELLIKDLRANMACFKGTFKERLILGVLSYNVGRTKILKSTLYKIIWNLSPEEIEKEYCKWCYYNGVPHKGIKQRRIEEIKLILKAYEK